MPSRMYGYVRSRQLEGTYNDDHTIGNWIISSMRVARGWGTPSDEQWPYDGRAEAWLPTEPPEMDLLAKGHRIFAYERVRSVSDCKYALAQRELPIVAFDIVHADWTNAKKGLIPSPMSPSDAGHCVVLGGYNDAEQNFTFRNSWGAGWGDRGNGRLSYEYFERYHVEGWIIPNAKRFRPQKRIKGIAEACWGIVGRLTDRPLHGFEYIDVRNDECIAWAFVVERNGFAEVEELFVRPTFRGQGYGRRLANLILSSKRIEGLPLRLWVSHADSQIMTDAAALQTLRRLGLKHVNPSGARWAAYLATA